MCSDGTCTDKELGPNLVVNGDFSDGDQNWQFTSAIEAVYDVSDGAICVTLSVGGFGVLGYPTVAPLLLVGAKSYEFSFEAWSNQDLDLGITAKVGDAEPPYTDYSAQVITVNTTSTRYTQRFVQVQNDPTAGVAFVLSSPSAPVVVCFDNVTVRPIP